MELLKIIMFLTVNMLHEYGNSIRFRFETQVEDISLNKLFFQHCCRSVLCGKLRYITCGDNIACIVPATSRTFKHNIICIMMALDIIY